MPRSLLLALSVATLLVSGAAHAAVPYNPPPCEEPWVCVQEPSAELSASNSTVCVGHSTTVHAVVTVTPGIKRRCGITDAVGMTPHGMEWSVSGPNGFSVAGIGLDATFTPPTAGTYLVGWNGTAHADDPCSAILPLSAVASIATTPDTCDQPPSIAMTATGPEQLCIGVDGTWKATVTTTPGVAQGCEGSKPVGVHGLEITWQASGPNGFAKSGTGDTAVFALPAVGDYLITWIAVASPDAPCTGVLSTYALNRVSDDGRCRYDAVITTSSEGPSDVCTGKDASFSFVTQIAPGLIERCGESIPVVPTEKEITWKLTGPGGVSLSGNGRTVTYTPSTLGVYTITWVGTWYGKPPCRDPMTASDYHIFSAKCCASDAKITVKEELPDVAEYLKDFGERMKNIPWVKSFSANVSASFDLTRGEECCPSAAFPRPTTEVSGKVSGGASMEVLAPPPLATAGVFVFGLSTPGVRWLGVDKHEIFRAYGRWQLGLFAGLAGEVGFSASGKLQGCESCVTGEASVGGTITIGVTATGSGILSVAGGAFGGEVGVSGEVKASTGITFKATGTIAGECPKKLCGGGEVGGFKSSVSVTAKVKSGKWVNVAFSWDLPGPSADPKKVGPFCWPK